MMATLQEVPCRNASTSAADLAIEHNSHPNMRKPLLLTQPRGMTAHLHAHILVQSISLHCI